MLRLDRADIYMIHFSFARIMINPDKIPYNLSEVILWTLDDGNTIKTMQVVQLDRSLDFALVPPPYT